MSKLVFFTSICLLLYFTVNGQQKTRLKFTSINEVGVAWGSTDDGLQVQTINGFYYKTFSAGLGIGLDYYWERTIPVFIDLRKDIFNKKQTPFVYADLGTNLPWVKTKEENWWYKSEYDDGIYFDIGIGYKVPLNKTWFVNMSFGYSQKKIKETRKNKTVIDDFSPYGNYNTENFIYTLRRVSLKAGLGF
jgi:hypothetical protein